MRPAYREGRPPPGLERAVACVWENEPAEKCVQLVVPDGCVDLMWTHAGELVIAGADTGPQRFTLPAGGLTSALRLRPGVAGSVLGMPASELRDRRVAAAEVWGLKAGALEDTLAEAGPSDRLRVLARVVAERAAAPDPLVAAAARRLISHRGRVAGVAAELGVSERQLHRRTTAAVGYGPKVLARIARLRRLVAIGDGPLASRAFDAGYASQAHMSDEVRRLTGLTPVRFLEDATLTAA